MCQKVQSIDGNGWWYNNEGFNIKLKNSDLPEGIEPKWEDAEPIEVNIKINH